MLSHEEIVQKILRIPFPVRIWYGAKGENRGFLATGICVVNSDFIWCQNANGGRSQGIWTRTVFFAEHDEDDANVLICLPSPTDTLRGVLFPNETIADYYNH